MFNRVAFSLRAEFKPNKAHSQKLKISKRLLAEKFFNLGYISWALVCKNLHLSQGIELCE